MNLIESIKLLSNGTLGSLTGEHYLSKLEEIRFDFINFCIDIPEDLEWNKAWKIYRNFNIVITKVTNDINNNVYDSYDLYHNKLKETIYLYFHEYKSKHKLYSIIEMKIHAAISKFCKNTYCDDNIRNIIGNV